MALRTASLILTKPRPKLTLRLPAYAIVSAPQPAQVLAGYTKGEKGDKGDTGERGVDGLQGPPGVPAVWVGDYDPASAYAANDAVTYLGASWVSVSSIAPGNAPPGAGWVQIAAKGDTGPKGDKGDKGDTGSKGDKGDTGAALAIAGPDAASIFGIWVGSSPPPDPRWLWARATTSQIGTILEAVAGELGLAGFPPSVVGAILATGNLGAVGWAAGGAGLIVPPTGAMGLDAYAPWVVNPNAIIVVPAAVLGLGAYSPTLAGVIATALATDTRLAGFAPAGLGTIPPPAGVAALAAYAPTIAASGGGASFAIDGVFVGAQSSGVTSCTVTTSGPATLYAFCARTQSGDGSVGQSTDTLPSGASGSLSGWTEIVGAGATSPDGSGYSIGAIRVFKATASAALSGQVVTSTLSANNGDAGRLFIVAVKGGSGTGAVSGYTQPTPAAIKTSFTPQAAGSFVFGAIVNWLTSVAPTLSAGDTVLSLTGGGSADFTIGSGRVTLLALGSGGTAGTTASTAALTFGETAPTSGDGQLSIVEAKA